MTSHDDQLVDCLNDTFGLSLATIDEARDWLSSEQGQRTLDAWCAEGGGVIEVPAIAARPLDQVFGDRAGVVRESLSSAQAAEIAEALAAIAGDLDGPADTAERTAP